MERVFEMLTMGAYYKYSSTAFVTFNSRVTESIAQQMLLSHDALDIKHAPNPHDIIWENVAIPRSQVGAAKLRSFLLLLFIIDIFFICYCVGATSYKNNQYFAYCRLHILVFVSNFGESIFRQC